MLEPTEEGIQPSTVQRIGQVNINAGNGEPLPVKVHPAGGGPCRIKHCRIFRMLGSGKSAAVGMGKLAQVRKGVSTQPPRVPQVE